MENVPDSYDDFVDCTVRWMVKDGKIKTAILAQLRDNPKSNTSDVLEVLCDCLGIGESLELVDDEDEGEDIVVSASDTAGVMMRVS